MFRFGAKKEEEEDTTANIPHGPTQPSETGPGRRRLSHKFPGAPYPPPRSRREPPAGSAQLDRSRSEGDITQYMETDDTVGTFYPPSELDSITSDESSGELYVPEGNLGGDTETTRTTRSQTKVIMALGPAATDTMPELIKKLTAQTSKFGMLVDSYNDKRATIDPQRPEPNKIKVVVNALLVDHGIIQSLLDPLILLEGAKLAPGDTNRFIIESMKMKELVLGFEQDYENLKEAKAKWEYRDRQDDYQQQLTKAAAAGATIPFFDPNTGVISSPGSGATGSAGAGVDVLAQAMTRQTDSLVQNMLKVQLQNYSVMSKIGSKYDGKGNWFTFKTSWDTIEGDLTAMGISDAQKLIELKKVLDGSALQLITSLPEIDTNYANALNLLSTMYGDIMRVVKQAVNNILEVPERGLKLEQIHSILWTSMQTLKALKLTAEDQAFVLFSAIAEKALPMRARTEWFKVCQNKKDATAPTGTTAGEEDFFRVLINVMEKDEALKDKKEKTPTPAKTSGAALAYSKSIPSKSTDSTSTDTKQAKLEGLLLPVLKALGSQRGSKANVVPAEKMLQ